MTFLAQGRIQSQKCLPLLHRSLATQVSKGGKTDATSYCRALVQKHDYDSYLTSYFYPRKLQPAYFAIRAFNVELAMVKENVSNVTIGQMRMQFWRDAIKTLSTETPTQHPVILALHEATKLANLSGYHFKRIIDARESDLFNPTHMTLASLRDYSESTSSTINYLLLSLLSLPPSSSSLLSTANHSASHLGLASTITTLLRALPFHLRQHSHIVIPAEITAKHGVSHEDVLRNGPNAKGINDAVFDFACVAKEELDVAREHMMEGEGFGGKVPSEVLPVFLSGVPLSSYLERLEAVNFDVFDPSLHVRDWKLPVRMWFDRRKGRF